MLDTLSSPFGCGPFGAIRLHCTLRTLGSLDFLCAPMSDKRQKLPTKRGQASEDPTPTFDVTRFVNEGAIDRFSTICKNRSFIKEKGFHHPEDFFRKTIATKGCQALFQPPRSAAMSVVR